VAVLSVSGVYVWSCRIGSLAQLSFGT